MALDLLKNVNISAGGVLPMCQDTGTAIVMGKKSEGVLTGADDGEAISLGRVRRLHQAQPALLPARAADDVGGEEHRHQPARPDRALLDARGTSDGPEYKFLFMAKGGGSANKSFLYPGDEGGPEPQADAGLPRREDPLARHGRLPAVPPGRRDRRHVGGVRAEDREVRLGALPRQPADVGIAGRRTASATSSSRRRSSS